MINLYFCNGKAFVWNSKDVLALREDHHIVGSLVGNYPIKPFQIQTKWLPLQLMPEETKLLIDKGIAQLVSLPKEKPNSTVALAFYEKRNKICEDQISVFKEHRKQQILEKADKIFEGKKRKYLQNLEKKKVQKLSEPPVDATADTSSLQNTGVETKSADGENSSSSALVSEENMESESAAVSDDKEEKNDSKSESQECDTESLNLDKTAIIEAELAKVTGINKEMCLVQLFTECPWKTKCDPVNWNFPSSEKEKLRYAVFKDLWEKKYYITSGLKFGGDFMAYAGDPLKYHALFIIVCLSHGQKFQGYDLVTYGRLGHQVKKTVALASLNDCGEVEYISLSWENEMT